MDINMVLVEIMVEWVVLLAVVMALEKPLSVTG